MYTRTVKYKGLNGQDKEKVLHFIVQRKDGLENIEKYQEYLKLAEEVALLPKDAEIDDLLSRQLMQALLDVIKLSYAEVDIENDIVDKSKQVQTNFENSLAYEALLNEIIERPELATEIITGIAETAPLNDAEKAQLGLDKKIVAIPNKVEPKRELTEVEKLRKELDELKNGGPNNA